jgi:hypothetical protein
MTAGQLIEVLQQVDPSLPVVYEYDGGHSYPEIERAALVSGGPKEVPESVCLFEVSTPDCWAVKIKRMLAIPEVAA